MERSERVKFGAEMGAMFFPVAVAYTTIQARSHDRYLVRSSAYMQFMKEIAAEMVEELYGGDVDALLARADAIVSKDEHVLEEVKAHGRTGAGIADEEPSEFAEDAQAGFRMVRVTLAMALLAETNVIKGGRRHARCLGYIKHLAKGVLQDVPKEERRSIIEEAESILATEQWPGKKLT